MIKRLLGVVFILGLNAGLLYLRPNSYNNQSKGAMQESGGLEMPKLHLVAEIVPKIKLNLSLCLNPSWLNNLPSTGCYVLSPPLPSDGAYELFRRIRKKRTLFRSLILKDSLSYFGLNLFLRFTKIKHMGYPIPLSQISREPWSLELAEQQELLASLEQLLDGRILGEGLIKNQLKQQGWWPADILRGLQVGIYEGRLSFLPGCTKFSWDVTRCNRCNSQIFAHRPCLECGRSDCPICTECKALGTIRGCNRLWLLSPENKIMEQRGCKKNITFSLDFSLTPAQRRASNKLINFIHSQRGYVMVWAACGAGKTEVTFAAIQQVLAGGGQVLFAIPRRDVVIQLADRIQRAFSNVKVATHYGGKPWNQKGSLVVATTHQALRFYQRFDLVILDEVDAYPYQGSEILRYAIQRSLKPKGKLIEMTATPKKLAADPDLITLPARYHGYPLPEPKLLKIALPDIGTTTGKLLLPNEIISIIQKQNAPWLVFVPTINAAKSVAASLSNQLGRGVSFCYAADPKRDMKIKKFLQGGFQVMVTTSIMERGITVTNVQAMVLYCNHPVYDVNSLIQMAGRVGRNKAYAQGEVWFIHESTEDKITAACNRIRFLNRQARKQGLLRGCH